METSTSLTTSTIRWATVGGISGATVTAAIMLPAAAFGSQIMLFACLAANSHSQERDECSTRAFSTIGHITMKLVTQGLMDGVALGATARLIVACSNKLFG